ncbi:hypothetical protein B0A55_10835 [Friedmanniomyces simplex]|uniref:Uncharacterized protein n=1 Tax=Friedmanniomyces simplex TaxID=329884 RepID=A0A4U0WSP8_9PEZI|nr:hypothetical protein B0A55_10835 [Friedmanniomyces simplex]
MGAKHKAVAPPLDPQEGSSKDAPVPATKKPRAARGTGQQEEYYETPTKDFVVASTKRDAARFPAPVFDGEEAVKKLALHLAHTLQFIEWIKCPTLLDQVQAFHEKWWKGYGKKTLSPQDDVRARAQRILLDIVNFANSTIDSLQAPDPSIGEEAEKHRQMLFRFQKSRQRMMEAIHTMTTTQHAVAHELQDAIAESAEAARGSDKEEEASASSRYEALVRELSLLESVKQEFREILNSCEVNDAGVNILDNLLAVMPDRGRVSLLYRTIAEPDVPTFTKEPEEISAHSDDEEKPEEPSVLAEDVLDTASVQREIERIHGFAPDYVLTIDDKKMANEVFVPLTGTKKARSEPLQKTEDISKPVFWLNALSSDIDQARFELVFQEFENIQQCPESCRKAKKSDRIWHWQATQHLNVIKDNMWHVRNFVEGLVNDRLLRAVGPGEDVKAMLNQTLRRMWALLALAYGCFGDIDLLCTVMDRLLEDLAGLLLGQVDPKMETIAMQEVFKAIAKDNAGQSPRLVNFMKTEAVLESHHQARLIYSEIARFYRGAIVLAVSKVSPTQRSKDQQELWYHNFLKYLDSCGHPSCKEQLKVTRMDWGKDSDGSRSIAKDKKGKKKGRGKGKAKATEGEEEEEEEEEPVEPAKIKTKRSISVAVKDARVGFTDERSHLSKNRPDAYPCLSALLYNSKYNVALGVFFHYFTHLYRPACRPFRGKYGLLDDVTLLAKSS